MTVLMIVDSFSRWVEAVPAETTTCSHSAKALLKDYIPLPVNSDMLTSNFIGTLTILFTPQIDEIDKQRQKVMHNNKKCPTKVF